MKIAIGCDHIVTDVKNRLRDDLIEQGHDVIDVGTYDFERTHYPIYGQKVGHLVAKGIVDYGIVLCGTGVGISNSAQKVKGARVALVSDVLTAKIAREQYDANILSFGGRVIGYGSITDIVDTFFNTEYKGNNKELIEKINNLGSDEDISFDPFLEKWNKGCYVD